MHRPKRSASPVWNCAPWLDEPNALVAGDVSMEIVMGVAFSGCPFHYGCFIITAS